jgi:predicted phage baseplate assembly protein
VTVPEVRLDDRDFPSLVKEARQRIAETCPEWTEHNVSDPGITLIELFAWMTDQLIYRVNRIPEKLEVAMLNLLDVDLQPSAPACCRLRFLLASDRKADVAIPAGTEVATRREGDEEPVVFATTQGRRVRMLQLRGMATSRARTVSGIPVDDDGVARPSASGRAIFATAPRQNDALFLGTSAALGNLVVDVRAACNPAKGLGIDPDLPPWVWETSAAHGEWRPVKVLSDTTGGFNLALGVVRLEIPHDTFAATIAGRTLHWLRCSPGPPPSSEADGYSAAPEISEVSLAAVGATLPAEHSLAVEKEALGYSDGTTGQTFPLTRTPVLAPRDGDAVEVHSPGSDEPEPWTFVETFANSSALDEHVKLDPASGEIEFGPAIRVPGGWRQYGAIPPLGAKLQITRYRHGGGHTGNLDAGQLTTLRQAIPGVASVSNPDAAVGGLEVESVAEARVRAPREVHTRERAVTARDFELLACREVAAVFRARCLPGEPGKAVRVHVLPKVVKPPGERVPTDLVARDDLLSAVKRVLEARCLLGTFVHVTPVKLQVVTCAVEVEIDGRRHGRDVERDVEAALYGYLDPYVGGSPTTKAGNGWPWGRTLHQGEIEPIVRRVPGVQHVVLLRIYTSPVDAAYPTGPPLNGPLPLGPHEVIASGRHRVKVVPVRGA